MNNGFFSHMIPLTHKSTELLTITEKSSLCYTGKGKEKSARIGRMILWRRHPESNRGIRVLQTRALPLGYVAEFK